MQIKLKRLMLWSSLTIGAIALIPIIALAQSQRMTGMPLMQRALEQLNLNADQQTQVQQIRDQTRTQLENLLTAEQRQQLDTALNQGKPLHQAIDSLNLTEDQKTQSWQILKDSREQMRAILTPEQQQQLSQFRQSHRDQSHRDQSHRGMMRGMLGQIPAEVAERLNLTQDQQNQLNQIRENTRTQLENLLTAEQKQQLQTAIDQGKLFPEAMADLNLTETQRSQRREIFQSAREQASTVLTAEQQQQIRETMRAHRQQNRQQNPQ